MRRDPTSEIVVSYESTQALKRRRWVVRVMSVAVVGMCVGTWFWSYFYRAQITYTGQTQWAFEIGRGSVFLGRSPAAGKPGWKWTHGGPDPEAEVLDLAGGVRVLGFHFHSASAPPANWSWAFVRIPFWFVSLGSLSIVLCVWRGRRYCVLP